MRRTACCPRSTFTGERGLRALLLLDARVIHGSPWYFTGEEELKNGVHNGSSIAMNAETASGETEHFGHLQHENIVPTKLSSGSSSPRTTLPRRSGRLPLRVHRELFKAAISGDPSKGSLTSGRPTTDAVDRHPEGPDVVGPVRR